MNRTDDLAATCQEAIGPNWPGFFQGSRKRAAVPIRGPFPPVVFVGFFGDLVEGYAPWTRARVALLAVHVALYRG